MLLLVLVCLLFVLWHKYTLVVLHNVDLEFERNVWEDVSWQIAVWFGDTILDPKLIVEEALNEINV